MKYECWSRFKSEIGYIYRVGDIVIQAGYDRLTKKEQKYFREKKESFADQIEENIREDDRLEKE